MSQDQPDQSGLQRFLLHLHIDAILLGLILIVMTLGLFVLYSASGESSAAVVGQLKRIALGLVVMLGLAQVNPDTFRGIAPWVYAGGLILLVLVLVLGDTAKGAQRWLDLGVIRFQPSELMKLAVPMVLASYLHARTLPPRFRTVLAGTTLLVVPTALIMQQPDLGTALMIGISGGFVLYMAGLRWRIIGGVALAGAAALPLLWSQMHGYQRERVLTFLNPARDPGGAGYHITQSKVAIGSGGLFGKGWLNGTQAQLDFLPESATDFIFAVYAEEVGLLGVLLLLILYLAIVGRGLFIAVKGQDSFQRLLAGSLSLVFFFYVFVNIGMVIGLLPVVGVPLPLISQGGTSMVSLLAGMGVLMSIHTHRRLLAS
ncbi:MAG: rod shape-determining protein RodA [Pseudomonadota bacterium]|nr:rod shape-determining protein RodA [Pseudomonadota bacterium]